MKPIFRLIPTTISKDTVEALEELLSDAQKGEIIGFAFAAMYRKRAYMVDLTGEAARNPTFTRGMIAALDDAISRTVGPAA